MAEFLVKMEGDQSDPLAWSRLDPVCVFEDGHPWGAMERPPKFLVVRVTGLSAADGQQYMDTVMDLTNPENPLPVRLRAFKFDLDKSSLPNLIRKAIDKAMLDGGAITVSIAQAQAFIKRMT